MQMGHSFQFLLDSGWLYLALGAVICIFLGVGAARRLFQGAKRAEPPDPDRRLRRKD
jgi:hypothetical protein